MLLQNNTIFFSWKQQLPYVKLIAVMSIGLTLVKAKAKCLDSFPSI